MRAENWPQKHTNTYSVIMMIDGAAALPLTVSLCIP